MATRKTCTRCKRKRSVERFYGDKHMKDGLTSWCRDCTREYDRVYRERKRSGS